MTLNKPKWSIIKKFFKNLSNNKSINSQPKLKKIKKKPKLNKIKKFFRNLYNNKSIY